MKKNIIYSLLLSIFLGTGLTFAQGRGAQMDQKLSPEQKAAKVSDRLEKSLGLSAEQKTKVHDLTLEKINLTREARAKDAKDKKSLGESFKSIRRDYDAGMKEVLTDEQEVKWEQIKANAKARREKKKGEAGKGVAPTDDPEKDLDLELED